MWQAVTACSLARLRARHPQRYPALQAVKYLCEMINKKDKKANVKPFMAKNYLWVFVNCLIENPAFDSQVLGGCRAGTGGIGGGPGLRWGREGWAGEREGAGRGTLPASDTPSLCLPLTRLRATSPPAPPLPPQTKDTLTLRASSFGSKCELPDAFLKKVANCGVVDLILSFASFKADKELKKGDGAKRQRLTGALPDGTAISAAVAASFPGNNAR